MDHFNGPVWASHSNCRALVPHNRQFDDRQLKELISRGAVIGGAYFFNPRWSLDLELGYAGIPTDDIVTHEVSATLAGAYHF